MFHRIGEAAYKNSLDNTLKLDEIFGHPHRNYKTVHVAGTNGKGSHRHMYWLLFFSRRVIKPGYIHLPI
jgi:dihydrofolate synthase / folylpolyglutamate synthase